MLEFTRKCASAQPPANAQFIMRRSDLPPERAKKAYSIGPGDGEKRTVHLDKISRQVVDALRSGPVFAASPVRISDRVLILRRDYGIEIETLMIYPADGGRYGIYRLVSCVTPIADEEGAE